MKKILVIILMFCAVTVNAEKLKWDAVASTPDCTIAGYIVYWGTSEGVYDKNLNVGNVTTALDIDNTLNLFPGTLYYFVVAAYSSINVIGPYSNMISYTYVIGDLPTDNVGDTVIYTPGPTNITIIVE